MPIKTAGTNTIYNTKQLSKPIPDTSNYKPQSIMDSIKTGIGLGIGLKITDSIFGNRQIEVINKSEKQTTQNNNIPKISTSTFMNNDKCNYILDEYRINNCIMNTNNDNNKCNELYEKFYRCQKNA